MSDTHEWVGLVLLGVGPDRKFEIIEFVKDPATHHGSHTECLALDGTIVNSPAIRESISLFGAVVRDSAWAL